MNEREGNIPSKYETTASSRTRQGRRPAASAAGSGDKRRGRINNSGRRVHAIDSVGQPTAPAAAISPSPGMLTDTAVAAASAAKAVRGLTTTKSNTTAA